MEYFFYALHTRYLALNNKWYESYLTRSIEDDIVDIEKSAGYAIDKYS